MTTIALTPEGETFLARVRDELADLPPDERDELLEDIESHLAEVSGEGEVPLSVRLGSAEEFAQELRHSAGLPPRPEPEAPSRLHSVRSVLDGATRKAGSLWSQLDAALAWRLARGWLLAVAVAVLIARLSETSAWGHRHIWLPHPGLSGYSALLVLIAFIGASLWIGSRAAAGRGVQLDRVVSVIALLAIVPAAWHLDSPPRADHYVYTASPAPPVPGLAFNGMRVSNIFPFDRSGKPLNDVLLYLPDGRPLPVGAQAVDPNRRYLVTRRGQRLYNSFPVRYFDPGTSTVAHPTAGPVVHVPAVLTPPLRGQAP